MKIALIVNPVAGGWSPLNQDTHGGGEEAITLWSRAMVARGHDVTVYWDQPALDDTDGTVAYRPYGAIAPGADVVVYRKTDGSYRPDLSPRTVLWTDQSAGPLTWQPFGRIVVPSEFSRRCLVVRHEPAANKVLVMPDGFAPFPEPAPARLSKAVLHTSSPDRGLCDLLRIWPEVMEAHPDAQLLVTYGWDIFLRCGGSHGTKAEAEKLIGTMPSVTMVRLSFRAMQEAYQRAAVWAYYCTGGEHFCQAAVKAQMAGAVPVVKPWGALHETVWSGIKANTRTEFRDALIRALEPAAQAELRAAIEPRGFTWDQLAERWETLLADVPEGAEGHASKLVQVPDTPGNLVPAPDKAVLPLLQQYVPQFLARVQPQRPWADPSLGIHCRVLEGDEPTDAVIVGWGMEDCRLTPADILADMGVRDGTAVLLVTSLGPWRAKQRYRVWGRRDIIAVFGQQPELGTEVVPIDADGNAICFTSFRYRADKLGTRNLQRARTHAPARQTNSVCFIGPPRQRDVVIWRALRSIEPIADEVVLAINGDLAYEDRTGPDFCDLRTLVEAWEYETKIPVQVVDALSPLYCHDCLTIHTRGELTPGHRIAGFETPRNQSILPARGDFITWLDTDEMILHPDRIAKFLRPNVFNGYGIAQDHYSSDPPAAFKRDTPMRIFRRVMDKTQQGGFIPYGPEAWPTFNPGYTCRFAGLVHEHPGGEPNYTEGWGPVLMIPDVWIAHTGYLTEAMRRGRFVRNWPLMVLDRFKYPHRRLGLFLWLRDLAQQVRYAMDQNGGRVPPHAIPWAEEAVRIYEEHFAASAEPYSGDAAQYGAVAAQVLGRGFDVTVSIQGRKPEISGDDTVTVQMAGRVTDPKQLVKFVEGQLGQFDRWHGQYL